MSDYRLHCFAQSGNAYKPALMLQLARADWEPVFVDFMHGAHRSPGYQKINEMGEVPVLEHGDMRLSQSGVILDYLSGTLGLYGPRDEIERREILRWTLWDNHKFTSYIASLRFHLNFVPQGDRVAAVIAFLRGRAEGAMTVLDRHLDSRDWILGKRMTIADLSCCGYIFYGEEFGFDPDRFPALAAWAGRIRALPRWVHPYELMPGHPIPPAPGAA